MHTVPPLLAVFLGYGVVAVNQICWEDIVNATHYCRCHVDELLLRCRYYDAYEIFGLDLQRIEETLGPEVRCVGWEGLKLIASHDMVNEVMWSEASNRGFTIIGGDVSGRFGGSANIRWGFNPPHLQ